MPDDPGRVELVELHVLHRDAVAVRQRHAVAGQRVGVGGDPEHPPEPAGREQHRLRPDACAARRRRSGRPRRPAARPPEPELPTVGEQVHDVVLVVELDAVLDGLLVQGLQDHVPGPVGREARPPDRPLPVVAGVAAEPALVDLAVGRPVERQAHVLELDHRLDGLAGQDLGRVLVDQVVATLDGVEHVPLPVVLLEVPEGGTDAALGGAGVGAGGIELGQDRGVHAGLGELDGGPQAGAAGADDQRVVVDAASSPQARRDDVGEGDHDHVPITNRTTAQRCTAPSRSTVRAPAVDVVRRPPSACP